MFRKSIVVLNLMLGEKRSIFNDVQISLVNTNYAKKKKELNLRADKIWRRFGSAVTFLYQILQT